MKSPLPDEPVSSQRLSMARKGGVGSGGSDSGNTDFFGLDGPGIPKGVPRGRKELELTGGQRSAERKRRQGRLWLSAKEGTYHRSRFLLVVFLHAILELSRSPFQQDLNWAGRGLRVRVDLVPARGKLNSPAKVSTLSSPPGDHSCVPCSSQACERSLLSSSARFPSSCPTTAVAREQGRMERLGGAFGCVSCLGFGLGR